MKSKRPCVLSGSVTLTLGPSVGQTPGSPIGLKLSDGMEPRTSDKFSIVLCPGMAGERCCWSAANAEGHAGRYMAGRWEAMAATMP
jgi:hypothetical protein